MPRFADIDVYDFYDDPRRDDTPSGDPRRCPFHPNQITSSADGMHDGVCGQCEYEMSRDDDERKEGPDDIVRLLDPCDPEADADPVVALRMGHPVRLSSLPDDDFPF